MESSNYSPFSPGCLTWFDATTLDSAEPCLPIVAGPHINYFKRGAVAIHADLAFSIVEDKCRAMHLPLEGIEPLSRRRLRLSSVAHRHCGSVTKSTVQCKQGWEGGGGAGKDRLTLRMEGGEASA